MSVAAGFVITGSNTKMEGDKIGFCFSSDNRQNPSTFFCLKSEDALARHALMTHLFDSRAPFIPIVFGATTESEPLNAVATSLFYLRAWFLHGIYRRLYLKRRCTTTKTR